MKNFTFSLSSFHHPFLRPQALKATLLTMWSTPRPTCRTNPPLLNHVVPSPAHMSRQPTSAPYGRARGDVILSEAKDLPAAPSCRSVYSGSGAINPDNMFSLSLTDLQQKPSGPHLRTKSPFLSTRNTFRSPLEKKSPFLSAIRDRKEGYVV